MLEGIRAEDIASVRLLQDGSEMPIVRNWMTNNYPDKVFVDFGMPELPEKTDTVIRVTLKKPFGEEKKA